MRVLVCGGRDYKDEAAAFAVLDAQRQRVPYGTLVVIQGGAKGADALARKWSVIQADRIHSLINVPADWKTHGDAAGPIRNQRMVDEHHPELVIAFPRANGKWGSGTSDMIRRAERAGIKVIRIESNNGQSPGK